MEKGKDQKTQPITYYGKKAYRLNPLIARQKKPETILPDYENEKSTAQKTTK